MTIKMSDFIDSCDNEREAFYQEALNKQKNNRHLKPVGYCHFCNEKLNNKSHLFCDSFCREDYETKELIKSRQYAR